MLDTIHGYNTDKNTEIEITPIAKIALDKINDKSWMKDYLSTNELEKLIALILSQNETSKPWVARVPNRLKIFNVVEIETQKGISL